jgi:hypothetical protein
MTAGSHSEVQINYADQAERDYAALKAAVRKGKVAVYQQT